MKNYCIKNIEDPDIPLPDCTKPEIAARFKSMDFYLKTADKIIRRFAPQMVPSSMVRVLANSEDARAEVAMKLAMADWTYDESKGRTERSWLNQKGIWAIRDYLDAMRAKCNKEHYSLDFTIENNEGINSLYDLTENKKSTDPFSILTSNEKTEKDKKYVNFIMRYSGLTKVQKKCLHLYFYEGVKSYTKIGKQFDPPITRQAVQQCLHRGLFKLKQTAGSIKNETK